MNKLTVLNNNRELTIDSREVAQMLGIEHKLILRKLEGSKSAGMIGIIPILGENGIAPAKYFIESTYKDTQNKERKCYRSEEHTSELQSRQYLVCRLLLEK